MTSFEEIYDQSLSTLKSCTYADLDEDDLKAELYNLLVRAIASFRFPKIPLTYRVEEIPNFQGMLYKQGTFVNDIRQEEINVLLAYMKKYWMEFQISQENRFLNPYYDSNVKGYSPGNILSQLKNTYEIFSEEAEQANYNYSRVDLSGRPALGLLNDE